MVEHLTLFVRVQHYIHSTAMRPVTNFTDLLLAFERASYFVLFSILDGHCNVFLYRLYAHTQTCTKHNTCTFHLCTETIYLCLVFMFLTRNISIFFSLKNFYWLPSGIFKRGFSRFSISIFVFGYQIFPLISGSRYFFTHGWILANGLNW